MVSDKVTDNYVQLAILRFHGHYDHWSMLMENFLRSKEYWSLLETGIVEPESGVVLTELQQKKLDESKLKDLKAKNYLFQAIDRSILETILQKDTSKQIWDSMKKKYQGSTKVKRSMLQALRKDFETLQMKQGESVNDYFSKAMAIANKMSIHGEKMEDVTIVEKILRSMTTKFDYVQEVVVVVDEDVVEAAAMEEVEVAEMGTNPMMIPATKTLMIPAVAAEAIIILEATAAEAEAKGARANFAEKEKKDDEAILMVCQTMEKPQKNVWYLDTSCSNHMFGEKSIFSTLDESFTTTVRFGDDSKVSVLGKGDIKIWAKDNSVHTISSVLFVPSLKRNLLSLGQLHEKGYEIKITGGACQIHDQKMGLIAKAYMTTNRMFPLHIQSDGPKCFYARVNDLAWLWHLRYGHLNFRGFKMLHDKEMVTGLPQITCPTEEKSEALNAFKHFKAAAENEIEKTIKVIRTDRGGEYNSKAFENFCAIHGVRRQLTTAYTPQQNGVAERKNRTILNMPEAVNWGIHILNRSPTFAVRDLTPEEAWSGRKPAVGYFKVFGCIAYARIPDEKRKKLDDKGEKCVFLGISEISKAYKLFNPASKKIIISRDVVFDEEKTWNWSDDVSLQQQNILVNFDDSVEQQQPQQCISAPTSSVVPAPTSSSVPAPVVPPIGA
ncbi:PREDICTED: uncharacterized protein LOC107881140 [Prunus mume]|uniref:Uncharacterized protein LOC107881140 n=1 Tax=Prunus mume TaxID=102107 RepID=A0ABM1LQQ1_PRUMU|nr:PREDICTED: uncharacterized protein LOC107881140 [Prunus mume]